MTNTDPAARSSPYQARTTTHQQRQTFQDTSPIRAALVRALDKLDGSSTGPSSCKSDPLPTWRATRTAAWRAATLLESAATSFAAAILEPTSALIASVKAADVTTDCAQHLITDMHLVHKALVKQDIITYQLAVRLDNMPVAAANAAMHDLAVVVKQVDHVLSELNQRIGAFNAFRSDIANRCAKQPRTDLDPFLVGVLVLVAGLAAGVLAVASITRTTPPMTMTLASHVVTTAVAAATSPGAVRVAPTTIVSAVGSFWGLVPAAAARAAASKAASAAACAAHRAASATVVAMAQVAALVVAVVAALVAAAGAFGAGRTMERRIRRCFEVLNKVNEVERGLVACREKIQGAGEELGVVVRGVLVAVTATEE